LISGDSADLCWNEFARQVGSPAAGRHPWLELTERLRQSDATARDRLQRSGWGTLKAVLRLYPELLRYSIGRKFQSALWPNPRVLSLPARDFAAELRRGASLEDIAGDLALLASGSHLKLEEWWQALFHELPQGAIDSIVRSLAPKLKPDARQALLRARVPAEKAASG
jgi:hypothetical protein